MTIVLSEGGIGLMTTDELVKQSFASLKVGAFEIRPGNPRQARCAAAVVRTVGFPRPVAYLMGLSSLTYFVQGWVAGTGRFSQTHTFAIVLTEVLSAAWMTWLLVAAWRTQDSVPARLANEGVGRPAAI